jgi:hypothetical protein
MSRLSVIVRYSDVAALGKPIGGAAAGTVSRAWPLPGLPALHRGAKVRSPSPHGGTAR